MKKNYIILFALLTFISKAQTWPWAKSANGSGADEGYSITTDASGNVFVTGAYSSSLITFGTNTLTNAGALDVFFSKYDASGNVIWAKRAGGSATDIGYSICTDPSNNVILTGIFRSPNIVFGSYTLTNIGSENIFLAKFDPNGNTIWAKSGGGTLLDESYSVVTDASGNIIITGRFDSPTITFGTYTLTNSGVYDVFIAKYDPNGNVLWAKSAGSSNVDEGWSVSTDPAGNTFLTGRYLSSTIVFGTYTLINVNSPNEDIFIAKYDPSGNVSWAKNIGGTGSDAGIAISADPFGNAYVTGRFSSPAISFGTYTLTNSGSIDMFLAKYDNNGNALWAKSAVGSGNDIGWSVSADSSGAFVAGGFYVTLNSPSPLAFAAYTLTPAPGSPDPMFLTKYDKNGNVVCASFLTSGGDDLIGVRSGQSGDVYVTSDFMANPFSVGTTTLTQTGGENIFVAKYHCADPLAIKELKNSDLIKAFPNPSNGSFRLELEEQIENGEIILINSLGQKVHEQKIFQGTNNIITYDLATGLYNYIILENKGQISNGKLIVE